MKLINPRNASARIIHKQAKLEGKTSPGFSYTFPLGFSLQFLAVTNQKTQEMKETYKRSMPVSTLDRRKTRVRIINKTSYFLSNSVNKSLNH